MASPRRPFPPSRVSRNRFGIDFINATVSVPPVAFLGNTHVVTLYPSTTLTGPGDRRTVGCSSRLAPRIGARTLSRTSTHTLSKRDSVARACRRGGMVQKKLPALANVCLSRCCLHRARNSASGASQHSATCAAPGVSSWHCVLYRSAQHIVRTWSIFAAAGPATSTSRPTHR